MFFVIIHIYFIYSSFLKEYSRNKIGEDALKAILTISKKYTSDTFDNISIKNSYENFLPSNSDVYLEYKKNILLLLNKMMEEGIIKKGGLGSDIIEEIMFIMENTEKKKEMTSTKEDFKNEINNFMRIANEKGFEGKLWKNKNIILADFIFVDWMKLFKKVCIDF